MKFSRADADAACARTGRTHATDAQREWITRTSQAIVDNPRIMAALKSAVQNRGAPGVTVKGAKAALVNDLLREFISDPNILKAVAGKGSPVHSPAAAAADRDRRPPAPSVAAWARGLIRDATAYTLADAAYPPPRQQQPATGPCPECGAETEYGPCDCAPSAPADPPQRL